MTLILTAVCDKFIVQVSDRRFVSDGANLEVAHDESNKQVLVNAEGLRLVAGFAGLAKTKDEVWSTGFWLAEQIATERALAGAFEGCLEAVREGADLRMDGIFQRFGTRAPLSLVFAGYVGGSLAPVVATVSNCRSRTFRGREVGERFETTRSAMAGRHVWPEGLVGALPNDTEARLRAVLKRGDPAAVTDVAVEQIRKASHHGKLGRGVGSNCMSVCILRDGPAEAVYHPVHGRPETWSPIFVEQKEGMGIYIVGGGASMVVGSPPPGVGPMPVSFGMSQTPVLDRRMLTRKQQRT